MTFPGVDGCRPTYPARPLAAKPATPLPVRPPMNSARRPCTGCFQTESPRRNHGGFRILNATARRPLHVSEPPRDQGCGLTRRKRRRTKAASRVQGAGSLGQKRLQLVQRRNGRRAAVAADDDGAHGVAPPQAALQVPAFQQAGAIAGREAVAGDRKSTRLNSSHVKISYAVFCLKKKRQMPNKYAEHHPRNEWYS